MIKLESCPFCGADCTIAYNFKPNTNAAEYIPFCTNDECFMNMNEVGFPTEEEVGQAWNKREG